MTLPLLQDVAWPDPWKKARYAWSFLHDRLIHTNLQLLFDCNFRCEICDFWKESFVSSPRLQLEDARTIAGRLAEVGPQIVSLGGGEPLLHPDLIEIVRIFARRHFPVMICNGWFVTPENARALFEAGIYEVSISIDYADAARHDRQRGREGAFERACQALKTLNEARVHPWQRVHMITVVMEDNLEEVEPLIQLSRRLGVTWLLTLYSNSRGCKPRRDPPHDVSAQLLALKDRYPEVVALRGYMARFSQAIRENGVGPCYAGKNLLDVDARGDVHLCIDRLGEPVANLLRDDMRTVERRLLEAFERNTCQSCWTSCRGAIETLRHAGPAQVLPNLLDYHRMTRPMPLS